MHLPRILLLLLLSCHSHLAVSLDTSIVRRLRQQLSQMTATGMSYIQPDRLFATANLVLFAGDDRDLQQVQVTSVMDRCYNDLSQVTANNNTLTQDEYVNLVRNITEGNVDVDDYGQLPALYVMIFYATSCADELKRCDNREVTVAVEREGKDYDNLVFFCTSLYTETKTESTVTFEYTVRYDPNSIESVDIPGCLETATERALFSGLGCNYTRRSRPIKSGRKKFTHKAPKPNHIRRLDRDTMRIIERMLQDPSSMSMSTSTSSPADTMSPTSAPTQSTDGGTAQAAEGATSSPAEPGCAYDVSVRIPTLIDYGMYTTMPANTRIRGGFLCACLCFSLLLTLLCSLSLCHPAFSLQSSFIFYRLLVAATRSWHKMRLGTIDGYGYHCKVNRVIRGGTTRAHYSNTR
jgi:hypothetical protein